MCTFEKSWWTDASTAATYCAGAACGCACIGAQPFALRAIHR